MFQEESPAFQYAGKKVAEHQKVWKISLNKIKLT